MPNKKPLVLLFAGPRGHGKRELAKQLGHVLHSEPEYVDCSTVRRDDKLFGSSQADGAGSLLNYFLATKTGKRSIVFMDEFDKPDEAVCNTLLMAFYQGALLHWLASVFVQAETEVCRRVHRSSERKESGLLPNDLDSFNKQIRSKHAFCRWAQYR